MRRRGATVAGVLVALGAVAVAAIVSRGGGEGGPAPPLVDERAGVLRGVRFGDSAREVRAKLGEPTDDEDGFFPAGTDYTGPPAIAAPASDQRPPRKPETLHYGDTAYLVSPSVGVFSMATLAEGARTRAGVAVGDDLARVRERHRGARCGEAVAGEPLFGGDVPKYAWCRVQVGDVRVFFGDDPVESITLTRVAS